MVQIAFTTLNLAIFLSVLLDSMLIKRHNFFHHLNIIVFKIIYFSMNQLIISVNILKNSKLNIRMNLNEINNFENYKINLY